MKKKKKLLKLLALSQTGDRLDPRKIEIIAKRLTKKELSSYHQLLIKKRKEERVIITSAIAIPDASRLRLKSMFINKDAFFVKDPKILAGINVAISDFVFNASLRGYIDKMKKEYEIN